MKSTEALVLEMEGLAEAAYPHEGCGILLGRPGPEPELVEVKNGRNLREDRARDRYILDPRDQRAAAREAREKGLEVIGFWHSHPDHPARPSQYDADHAWAEYIYVIIAVDGGHAVDATAWRLESEDPPVFAPEPIQP